MRIIPHPRGDSLYPWVFTCSRPHCTLRVAVSEPVEPKHNCPYSGGTSTYGWSITVTLVEKMWKSLDSIMDEIALLETNQDDVDDLIFEANIKGRARGMADMIAIFMHPYFENTNEIAREAQRRLRARQANDATYETRGMNTLRYTSPPTDVDKYKREPKKEEKLPVSEEEAVKIRKAYGTFPTDMLAKAYNITEAQVKMIAESKPAEETV